MHILVVGLNHRTAPVEIREKFAVAEQQMGQVLQQLKQINSLLECVVVSTCNRMEVYTVVDRVKLCGQSILRFMEQWFGVPRTEIVNHLFVYEDEAAIRHLFRVASGLDSMVVGETQILGQVKEALFQAQAEKTTGTIFNTLFKQAITFAKRVHSETGIGEHPVSVSYAAVELAKRIFGDFSRKTVMIAGAGKMSELTVKHLYASGAEKVIVANRTLLKARELADKFGGTACTLEQMDDYLSRTDILISSTGAHGYIVSRHQIETAMRDRKSKPLFIIDIAVPRDVDPAIGQLNNVYLYDIDALQSIVQHNLHERSKEAIKIDAMIDGELEAFDQWYKTLGVAPLIRALQEKAGRIHEETMQSLMNKLPHLNDKELKIIRKLSKSIVNQMLRDPIVRVKELAADKHGDEALELFAHIFALEELAEPEHTGLSAAGSSVKQSMDNPQARTDQSKPVALQPQDLLAGT